MKRACTLLFLLSTSVQLTFASIDAALLVGTGSSDITPPAGTPSAGYMARQGEGMAGTHDALLATAMYIDNGTAQVAFCGVDNLGFTYEMTQRVAAKVQEHPLLRNCRVYIGSSHTHSGGGAYLNIPVIGAMLAGPYDPTVTAFYIDNTANAIVEAFENAQPALIGIGYGHAEGISQYRGEWPVDAAPLTDVAIIKATKEDGTPLGVLFNFPLHPTILSADNRLFSADFVGYAREEIAATLGENVEAIYFNGAQGEVQPFVTSDSDLFEQAHRIGSALAASVLDVWSSTEVKGTICIDCEKDTYTFVPQPTPFGMALPLDKYESELNAIILDRVHAFITIPGELSCCYDRLLKRMAAKYGYAHLSILGLVNDAHGYIIPPEAWRRHNAESRLSFGGENYGDAIIEKARLLLRRARR